jgi:iron complex transport system substrate-binding protein
VKEAIAMQLDRRSFLMLAGVAAATPFGAKADGRRPIVDLAGRTIALEGPVSRIILLDARDVMSMAILHPDPSRLIAGWAGAEQFDSDLVRKQYDRRPDGSSIPVVGGLTADSISVESIVALEPDLVVATAAMEPELGKGLLSRRLADAGIPLLFSSTASNSSPAAGNPGDPIKEMAQALRLWGSILDRGEKAESFMAFVRERLAGVAKRLAGTTATKTYLELQSTYDDCCWAAGRHIWGDLLTLAGGRNLSGIDAAWYAKISSEQLMAEAPEVYIASGGAFAAGMRPAIGPGLDPDQARAGLRQLVRRTGFNTLPAVKEGRVHGVWTGLLTVAPLNVLFVEIVAKWLHPQAFADLDPEKTREEINRRFLAKPLPGPCWLDLSP